MALQPHTPADRPQNANIHIFASHIFVRPALMQIKATEGAVLSCSLSTRGRPGVPQWSDSLVDDVVAAIDIDDLSGHVAGRIECEEGAGRADIVDRDKGAGGRIRFGLVQQGIEFGDA
jgi:hypothetical protein